MLSVDIKILPGFSTNKEEGDPHAACNDQADLDKTSEMRGDRSANRQRGHNLHS